MRPSRTVRHFGWVGPSSRRCACFESRVAGVVLSPCGVCRERLAVHGPNVLVAVAGAEDPALVVWKPLKEVLPECWMTVFPDEIDAAWTD
ncbi:MAG: cytidine deaminase [Solirubrobacteraceae bacterium]|jgi:cytidine deaminase|nr:cytidine deaminase [Solirubrobacteraceae bacterium]